MSMMRFGQFFRDLAMDETRCVTLLEPLELDGVTLPPDQYGFDELYCVKPGCDCRRVMLNVLALRAEAHVATINHGFDPPSDEDDPPDQTFLDPLNEQTALSPALLDLFVNQVLPDPDYRQRLRRHYRMFKNAVNDPMHPCHRIIHATPDPGILAIAGLEPDSRPRRSPIPPPPRRGKRKWR